ncbi:hypothetical protein Golax_008651 [Gossypium laxum]|uniref:Ubiquitin-like domain-containing protein n=1 Tax=Gossypium laxum TaxID=34288 RepID=A0A7J9AAQ0_9ROSI|nr:hypothetical protein [Gossypium laxum]
MADQHSNEGSSMGSTSGESSDSLVELKIKTLDSQIFSFLVDKNAPVSSFKEKIARELGVPVGRQRLIFRGKVLKDDHLLSEYRILSSFPLLWFTLCNISFTGFLDVENGHTLHLVERQPAQSQLSADASSGEADGNNSNRGNDAASGIPRNRVGQISHSVVLGTFNVGDQGDGSAPDLSRVIGAVLNSFGVGGQSTTNGTITQSSTSAPQGNETNGVRGGGENQQGNQTQSAPSFPGQSFQVAHQVMPIPLTAAQVSIPSLNTPIPDSLNALSEFMNRMEMHSPNGYQPHTSTTNTRDQPRVALPSDVRGLPTPEALSIVIRNAVRLLNSHAIGALSHIAERLEQERDSSDPTVRGQIQTESVQAGLTMQHLGSVLLELGRTILTLRMGNSPAESSVNAGPAVYISPSGPNPIMVQPFPLQTRSLFSGSHSPSNSLTVGPVGVGNAPRHINIHIHPGTALSPVVSAVGNRTNNGEGRQGERGNNAGSGSMRVLPVRNSVASAPQARATAAMSSAAQSAPTESSLSSMVAEINSRIRDLVSMQGDNQDASAGAGSQQPNNMVASGAGDSTVALPANLETEELKSQPEHAEGRNDNTESGESSQDISLGTVGCPPSSSGEPLVKLEDPSGSACRSSEENAEPVPLGLGLGGLERKRRVKPTKSSIAGVNGTASSSLDQNQSARMAGQQILQSLASQSSSLNRVDSSSGNQGVLGSRLSGGQGSDDQLAAANAVSQVLQSPALNGLLAGVSQQTGAGSPDNFRNMLQQLTQSPQIMNTVSQLAQQVDSQDIGNMFSGFGGGQGGGIDLSRMVQQMMPIVSQALGRGPSATPSFPAVESKSQDDIQQIAQRIEQSNVPDDVFHAVAENAVQVYGNGRNAEELLNELCGDEGLAKEYTEMLKQDLRQRFQDKSEKDKF